MLGVLKDDTSVDTILCGLPSARIPADSREKLRTIVASSAARSRRLCLRLAGRVLGVAFSCRIFILLAKYAAEF